MKNIDIPATWPHVSTKHLDALQSCSPFKKNAQETPLDELPKGGVRGFPRRGERGGTPHLHPVGTDIIRPLLVLQALENGLRVAWHEAWREGGPRSMGPAGDQPRTTNK